MQVYLARWQETDVAVKVLTQMQSLPLVQVMHPQDARGLQLSQPHGKTQALADPSGHDRARGIPHVGISPQGQQDNIALEKVGLLGGIRPFPQLTTTLRLEVHLNMTCACGCL